MSSSYSPIIPTVQKPRYRLDAVSLTLTLGQHDQETTSKKPLISGVSCVALPAQLLAIVGPSGAGKTSLLSLLSGAPSASLVSGHLLLNSLPASLSSLRRLSAYVTQDDDTLFPLLTVRESLLFSSRLRLGRPSLSSLLSDLSLSHVSDSRVSSLSGGERRRVSIGIELVHDPQILLLDEPTSGLDSASALHILSLIRSIAVAHGKTVILTIHQPCFRILDLFDRLLLLSHGSVKHHGSLTSLHNKLIDSGLSIPPHVNVLEFAMDNLHLLPTETVSSPLPLMQKTKKEDVINGGKFRFANSMVGEVGVLTARFFKNVLRTKQLSSARMLQCVLAGVGLGTIFMNVDNVQTRVGFFAFTLTFLLSSTTEGLPVFLQERKIMSKETSRGAYRISSYVIANTLVFAPFLLLAAILYSLPVYWLVGLRRNLDAFLYFTLVVWMVMLMANSFVACFSALVPNFIMGNSLIAGFMGSFFLFSGYFIAKRNIPKYWIFMHYLSLFKYPFEGFMINEYQGSVEGELLLSEQGLVEVEKWRNLGVMMGFIVGYRVICLVILWVRCCKLRR